MDNLISNWTMFCQEITLKVHRSVLEFILSSTAANLENGIKLQIRDL